VAVPSMPRFAGPILTFRTGVSTWPLYTTTVLLYFESPCIRSVYNRFCQISLNGTTWCSAFICVLYHKWPHFATPKTPNFQRTEKLLLPAISQSMATRLIPHTCIITDVARNCNPYG